MTEPVSLTPPARRLHIRIKKQADGSAALSCTRPDGSVTWQRQEGAHGQFFPLHDLTHYAVETVLGYQSGFYGLVAQGWNVTDFGAPWPRGRIPADAEPAEFIVGFLDAERASRDQWNAEELNDKLRLHGVPDSRFVTEAQLQAIRALRGELFERWRAVAPGAALELTFAAG